MVDTEITVYHFLLEVEPYHCKYEVRKNERNGLWMWTKVPGSEEPCNCYGRATAGKALIAMTEV